MLFFYEAIFEVRNINLEDTEDPFKEVPFQVAAKSQYVEIEIPQ